MKYVAESTQTATDFIAPIAIEFLRSQNQFYYRGEIYELEFTPARQTVKVIDVKTGRVVIHARAVFADADNLMWQALPGDAVPDESDLVAFSKIQAYLNDLRLKIHREQLQRSRAKVATGITINQLVERTAVAA